MRISVVINVLFEPSSHVTLICHRHMAKSIFIKHGARETCLFVAIYVTMNYNAKDCWKKMATAALLKNARQLQL